jgi:ATP-dependent DNA ligase
MPGKHKLESMPQKDATLVEPMECLSVSKLPEGSQWLWEIKLDRYTAIAVKSDDRVNLYSRTRKSFNRQFSYIVDALADMPSGTVVDGELVAIDESGRPSFNLLQNFRSAASRIQYHIFDLLCLKGRDLTRLPLVERREPPAREDYFTQEQYTTRLARISPNISGQSLRSAITAGCAPRRYSAGSGATLT